MVKDIEYSKFKIGYKQIKNFPNQIEFEYDWKYPYHFHPSRWWALEWPSCSSSSQATRLDHLEMPNGNSNTSTTTTNSGQQQVHGKYLIRNAAAVPHETGSVAMGVWRGRADLPIIPRDRERHRLRECQTTGEEITRCEGIIRLGATISGRNSGHDRQVLHSQEEKKRGTEWTLGLGRAQFIIMIISQGPRYRLMWMG